MPFLLEQDIAQYWLQSEGKWLEQATIKYNSAVAFITLFFQL